MVNRNGTTAVAGAVSDLNMLDWELCRRINMVRFPRNVETDE